MKLQLDTVGKTIKIEGSVNLKELFDTLNKLLPKGLWEDFVLESHSTIVGWSAPIIIEKSVPYPYFPAPIWYGTSTNETMLPKNFGLGSDGKHYCLNEGTFNVQC